MKLTRSTVYALAALSYIARTEPRRPILAKQIAQHYQIPLDYLLKILQLLTRAEILSSIRGPLGGFLLNRTPQQISLLEIIEAIDGPLNAAATPTPPLPNLPEYQHAAKTCNLANQKAAQILKKTSLADLINQTAPNHL